MRKIARANAKPHSAKLTPQGHPRAVPASTLPLGPDQNVSLSWIKSIGEDLQELAMPLLYSLWCTEVRANGGHNKPSAGIQLDRRSGYAPA
jgi:hypothetical protein